MNGPIEDLLTEHLSDAEKARHRRSRWIVMVVLVLLVLVLTIAAALRMGGI